MTAVLALPLEVETPTLSFFVAGTPQTAGSKTQVPIVKGGEVVARRIVESGNRERKKTWRADLRAAAEQAIEGGEWEMPEASVALRLTIIIARRRPNGHMRTGRYAGTLKEWALGCRPVARPDSVKLVRAIEDALTGVLWADDSVICEHVISKRFSDQTELVRPDLEGVFVSVELT